MHSVLRVAHLLQYVKEVVDTVMLHGALDFQQQAYAYRYNVLGWLLATCPDGRYRDGAKAVQLAEKACELADYTDANCLCGLAAAHAEKGSFDDAVTWQRKALDLAPADEKDNMRTPLELFEAGKPYHEE